jgi:Pyruvate/2-oxoglutarate dehydrogenase complex, dehydrogenase (E1) component, eukaryotic type, alpha subunit
MATTSATRRSTAPRRTARALRTTIRSSISAILGLSDDEFERFDKEAVEMVDAALEFAKNGTDPQPEDAMKNIYA